MVRPRGPSWLRRLRPNRHRSQTDHPPHQESEFNVVGLTALPRVDVTYGYQESARVPVDAFIAAGANGIVLTGGVGDALKEGQAKGVIFFQSDRKGSGRVLESERQVSQRLITSDNLLPHKARIFLRLALTKTAASE